VTFDAFAEPGVASGAAVTRRGAAAEFLERAQAEGDDRFDDIGLGDAQAAAEVLLVAELVEFAGGQGFGHRRQARAGC